MRAYPRFIALNEFGGGREVRVNLDHITHVVPVGRGSHVHVTDGHFISVTQRPDEIAWTYDEMYEEEE